jgi:hypothetical protein
MFAKSVAPESFANELNDVQVALQSRFVQREPGHRECSEWRKGAHCENETVVTASQNMMQT